MNGDGEYRYMMATRAVHRLGDISSEKPDLCVVDAEPIFCSHPEDGLEGDCYVGQWVFGFGFINVKFPVETTRPLTEEEIVFYERGDYQLGNHTPQKMNIRDHT